MDCSQAGYDFVRTKLGSLAVVCREAAKYLDGVKLKLTIGNPTAARLAGLSIFIERSDRPEFSLERKLATRFAAGSWTQVEVAVPGVSEADVGKLRVRIAVNTLELAGRP
jgi:hypothetical protein